MGKFQVGYFEILTFFGDDEIVLKYKNLKSLKLIILMLDGVDCNIRLTFSIPSMLLLTLKTTDLKMQNRRIEELK